MKFVAISDTHAQHQKLQLPDGDVLVHAGDISGRGQEFEVTQFLEWFASQPHPVKIFIAGNHDFFFEKASPEKISQIIPPGIIYLNDNGTNINGIRIWGSPISPWFFNWAFNRHRGREIAEHWALIPTDTDILITHGPVHGILDKTVSNEYVGCEDLLATVESIKPKVHLCGHIHEAYGQVDKNGCRFINASVLNERYQLVNKPVVLEL